MQAMYRANTEPTCDSKSMYQDHMIVGGLTVDLVNPCHQLSKARASPYSFIQHECSENAKQKAIYALMHLQEFETE